MPRESNPTTCIVSLAVASVCFLAVAVASHAQPTFTNVTAAAGIDYIQGFNLGPVDSMTGGAAARDYDGDGWTDLFVTRFNDPPILYRNLGNGTFDDVTVTAGLDAMASASNGAAWGDVNNDGYPDLYVTSVEQGQPNHLYMNQGDGTFLEEAAARSAGVAGGMAFRFGTSVAFGDYDADGWLDLHTTEWGARDVNPPEVRSHARLLRNKGNAAPGTFVDMTATAGVSLDDQFGTGPVINPGAGTWSFASRFTDLDRDGHPDLVVASDFNTSRVYWNNGDGTFLDGTTTGNFGSDENGMGLTVGDYNADGLFDVFVTSIYHTDPPNQGHNSGGNYGTTGNRLYENNGDRTFTDATDAAGVRDGGWGWGTSFLDFDNDGDLDLAMTNGFLGPSSEFYTDTSRLWENNGDGTFTDVSTSSGIVDSDLGKGLLTFDYDNDGDLDMFLVNNSEQPILYRNDGGNASSWLKLELEGTTSNRDAIGAIITLELEDGSTLVREVDGGSNYLSQNDIVAHFGLGELTEPIDKLSILWGDGKRQTIRNVSPNQTLHIRQRGHRSRSEQAFAVPEPTGLFLSALIMVGSFARHLDRDTWPLHPASSKLTFCAPRF